MHGETIKGNLLFLFFCSKLIVVLKYHIDNANSTDGQTKDLLKAMKYLQYCMRFIVRSRQLFSEWVLCWDQLMMHVV